MAHWEKGSYLVTDDQSKINLEFVVSSLRTTYWAGERSRDRIETSIKNSVFLSLFEGDKQVGFTRIVTDFSVFAWICDVFVDPNHRKKGLGKWLVECALSHPSTTSGIQLLGTKDAHGLYEKYGFVRMEFMRRSATSNQTLDQSKAM